MGSFQGCMRKNKDGSNRITQKKKWCLWPTTSPFCKKIEDVSFKIKIRSQEQKEELVKRSDFNRCCRKRGREDIKRWLEADDTELHFMKESDRFFVLP